MTSDVSNAQVPVEAQPQAAAQIVADRYEILRPLSRGGQARTFLVRDVQTGEELALKELALARAGDWKGVELFERESRVLHSLSHAGIPRYVDTFTVDSEDGTHFYLVQEYVPGDSLRDVIERGELLDEAAAKDLLEKVLEILEYLHSLTPPVVHRDIKPANIMREPDGAIYLVDFGAVQEITQATVGGDTVVGTGGFMPPEQLVGKAVPSSDLYALGATVIYAMSGVHPGNLPVEHMRLQWTDLLDVTPAFEAFLRKMLEPFVDERFGSAAQALEVLRSGEASDTSTALTVSSPSGLESVGKVMRDPGGVVEFKSSASRLQIRIEPKPTSIDIRHLLATGIIGLCAALIGLANGATGLIVGGIVFVMYFAIYSTIYHLQRRRWEDLDFCDGKLYATRHGLLTEKTFSAPLQQLKPARSVYSDFESKPPSIALTGYDGTYTFGANLGHETQRAICDHINHFLESQSR